MARDAAPTPTRKGTTTSQDAAGPTASEAWIAELLAAGISPDEVDDAIVRLARVLTERFGRQVEVRPIGASELVASGESSEAAGHDGEALAVGGDVRALVRGLPPDDDARSILALAGHALSLAQDRWTSAVRSDVWRLLGQADLDRSPIPEALDQLRHATRSDFVGLIGYRDGRFVADAFVGEVDDALLAALAERHPHDDAPLALAYRNGRGFVLPALDAPAATDAPTRACARSLAIHPMPLERYAHDFLVAGRFDSARWLESDRALLRETARALHLHQTLRRRADLLDAIVDLERRLLAREEAHPMQRIIDTLVRIVPGAEGGTILVRDGDLFRYVGVNGYDPAELASVTFHEEELRRWYEDGRSEDGRARLLSAPDGIVSATRHAVGDKLDGHRALPTILTNLGLPIESQGRWAAFVNLDAFASPHAFLEQDRELLETFAPIVEFVLYESDVREELRRLASHDPLTGLLNRRAFDLTLQREMRRADRSKTPLTLMIMDVDEFKRLNDAFGHAAGDTALRDVADALKRTVRASDHVFRWGGDEFAALLPDTGDEGAARMVERLREAVATLPTPGTDLSLSVGVAVHAPGDLLDEDALLSRADATMYAAKRRRAR